MSADDKVGTDNSGKPEYEVGYRKPPEDKRFKKGRSGNPSGRPKREPSLAELVERELARKVTIMLEGQQRKVSKRELAARQLVAMGCSGNLSALKMIAGLEPPRPPVEDEEAVLEFTLILEEDDPRPHWQITRSGSH